MGPSKFSKKIPQVPTGKPQFPPAIVSTALLEKIVGEVEGQMSKVNSQAAR